MKVEDKPRGFGVKVGSLVRMHSDVDFRLRGFGIVVEITQRNEISELPVRVQVLWQKITTRGTCGVYALRLMNNEGR